MTAVAAKKDVPIRTLSLWLKKYRQFGLVGLARRDREDKGTPRKYDNQLKEAIEGLYLKNPTLSCASIHKLLETYCLQTNIVLPSYRSVCRIIGDIPDDMLILNNEGSKAYRQKYDLLHRRDADYPNEIWQADHVLMDIEVFNDKSQPQSPWLTVIIDDCSRVIAGYELSFLSPSSEKTALCLRHAIWRKPDAKWCVLGIPDALYTDHGADFTSNRIEQVCADLKIQMIYSQVGRPRGRGKIERFFRTLNQRLLSTLSSLCQQKQTPQYLSLKQLDEMVYAFIIEYNYEIHSEIDMSPISHWQKEGFLPRMLDSLEKLDLLLLTEVKPRQIQRDGIRFQGLRYIDITLSEYVGERVVIRYTPSDITSIRVYYHGKFLCQAVCNELAQEKKVGIKDIQHARNKRRRELKTAIKNRKSLVDAVISASRKDLNLSTIEEDIAKQTPVETTPKIRLYRHE